MRHTTGDRAAGTSPAQKFAVAVKYLRAGGLGARGHILALLDCFLNLTRYDILLVLSFPVRQRKGGVLVIDFILSVLVAVVSGVICHYITKWLDSDDSDN